MKRVVSTARKGEAKVRVGNGRVQVTFADNKDNPIEFKRADVPEFVKAGTFYVSLNEDGEILGMRPMMAIVRAKFSHFVSDKDEPPAPKEHPGGNGMTKEGKPFTYSAYRYMIAILNITSPEYKGMSIPVYLRYLFVDDGDGHVNIKGSGKNAEFLESFLESAGVYDDEIPFSENVLPKLQKFLLKRNAEFQVMLKGGNAESFMELPDAEDDDNWDKDDDDLKPDEETLDDDWDKDDEDAPPF